MAYYREILSGWISKSFIETRDDGTISLVRMITVASDTSSVAEQLDIYLVSQCHFRSSDIAFITHIQD